MLHHRIMAVGSSRVELLIYLFFSHDDVNFFLVFYIPGPHMIALLIQDIFLEKSKKRGNNLIGDHKLYLVSRNSQNFVT